MTLFDDLIKNQRSYDRILKPRNKAEDVFEPRKAWCLGKGCNRYMVLKGSCPRENCKERKNNDK